MKKTATLLFVLVSFTCGLSAQNYRMLNASSEYFFCATGTSDPYKVFGLKCDSVRGNIPDSVYFPYRILQQIVPPPSNGCDMDPHFPLWAGKEIHITNSNLHKWKTLSGDSVLIDPQTAIGDSQAIYLYPNGNRIIAIHVFDSLLTFAALTDSVQHLTLQVLDTSNNIVPGYWNGQEIIISKNNGVVQMPSIINFPNDHSIYFRVEAKRLKYADIYPWQAGDQIHEEYNCNYLGPPPFYYNNYKYNKFILARTTITPDSAVFTIRRVIQHTSNTPPTPTNSLTIDTIYYAVGGLSAYIEVKMPQQTIDSLRNYDLYLYPSDCGKLRMIDHIEMGTWMNQPGCISLNTFEPVIFDRTHIDGVAGNYYSEPPNPNNSGTSTIFQNTYWSIANSSCGTPLYLGVPELAASDFHTWPNPATDFLHFDSSVNISGCIFQVFDLTGKQIQSVTLENNVPVDVRNLASGLYVGKIISANGNDQHNFRFVKK
jgi:hypothetical protein